MANAPVAPIVSLISSRRRATLPLPAGPRHVAADPAMISLMLASRRSFRAAPIPIDIEGAIESLYKSSPALGGSGLPLFMGTPPGGMTIPCVAYDEVARTPSFNGGTGFYEYIDLRFRCYHLSADEARAVARSLFGAVSTGRLGFQTGYLMSMRGTGGSSMEDKARTSGNRRVFLRIVTFRAKVGRRSP